MAAYDYFSVANASVENVSYNNRTYGDSVRALLWTARYAVAGPNTITIQFPDILETASTTASNYTLSGPSAPTISSVTFTAGSRSVLLNLSGPLSSINTYTLAIKPNTVASYYNTNWSNLVVDVILPTTIACVGVGVDQIVDLGTPNINMTGDAVGVGFEQIIAIGDVSASTLIRPDGVGVQQDVVFGSPVMYAQTEALGVGIAQLVDMGTPSIIQQQQPLGVGIAQLVDIGSPVANITPITLSNTGFEQAIFLGDPAITGSGSVVGVGVDQAVTLGTPIATRDNTQDVFGVGIEQLIELGIPGPSINQPFLMVGVEQPIDLGSPLVEQATVIDGVGFEQLIDLGLPFTYLGRGLTTRQKNALIDLDDALHKAFSEGVAQVALPNTIEPMNGYITQLSVLQQTQTRLPFKLAAAAEMFSFNIPGAFPNTNDTDVTSIAKLSGVGSEGSLIFVDGRLVIKTDPT
jgi:hypothetical protein